MTDTGGVAVSRRRAELGEDAGDPTRSTSLNILISGIYAWIATVALPAFAESTAFLPRACALAALAALLLGVALLGRFPTWGRFATLIGFVGLSAVTWVALGPALDVERLEPVRASLGGVGWMLFAFGWGAVRRPGSVPEHDPHVILGAPLEPRARLPRRNAFVFALSVLLGLSAWFLAWRVADEKRALLAHSVALACAIGMITAGAWVSAGLGQGHVFPRATARLEAASTPLAALLVLGMLGLLLWALAG